MGKRRMRLEQSDFGSSQKPWPVWGKLATEAGQASRSAAIKAAAQLRNNRHAAPSPYLQESRCRGAHNQFNPRPRRSGCHHAALEGAERGLQRLDLRLPAPLALLEGGADVVTRGPQVCQVLRHLAEFHLCAVELIVGLLLPLLELSEFGLLCVQVLLRCSAKNLVRLEGL